MARGLTSEFFLNVGKKTPIKDVFWVAEVSRQAGLFLFEKKSFSVRMVKMRVTNGAQYVFWG